MDSPFNGGLDLNKAFVGYDEKEVKEEILQLQKNYAEKKKQLQQRIAVAKMENQELKKHWSSLREDVPGDFLKESIQTKLADVFFEHTSWIKNVKLELEEAEKPYREAVKRKQQQKEQALRRMEEARAFLKALQGEYSILLKELDQ